MHNKKVHIWLFWLWINFLRFNQTSFRLNKMKRKTHRNMNPSSNTNQTVTECFDIYFYLLSCFACSYCDWIGVKKLTFYRKLLWTLYFYILWWNVLIFDLILAQVAEGFGIEILSMLIYGHGFWPLQDFVLAVATFVAHPFSNTSKIKKGKPSKPNLT